MYLVPGTALSKHIFSKRATPHFFTLSSRNTLPNFEFYLVSKMAQTLEAGKYRLSVEPARSISAVLAKKLLFVLFCFVK